MNFTSLDKAMLTPRQAEVAALVAKGMSNKAIARQTGISPHTVSVHVKAAAQRIDAVGSPRHRLTLYALAEPSKP